MFTLEGNHKIVITKGSLKRGQGEIVKGTLTHCAKEINLQAVAGGRGENLTCLAE